MGALFPQDRGFTTVIGPAFASRPGRRDLRAVRPVRRGLPGRRHHRSATRSTRSGRPSTIPTSTSWCRRLRPSAPPWASASAIQPGTLVTGKMVAALRRLGFDAVFDTNFAADLTIIEEGTELLMRLKAALVDKKPVALPMFTSCSPGWINYMEHFNPDLLPNLSTLQVVRSRCSGRWPRPTTPRSSASGPRTSSWSAIMPCTAKKFECQRPEMDDSAACSDVDVVLTTRELVRDDQAGRHRLRQPARREDGQAAGSVDRRRRHLRQHRRRDGGRAAHGLRARDRPAVPVREPARRPDRRARRRQGGRSADQGARAGLVVPRRRHGEGRRGPRRWATPRRSSTPSRAARPSTTSSRS